MTVSQNNGGSAKVQHYVPQFLLKNFGAGKKHRLHVFDKRTGGIFVTKPRNVAGESRFYDFQIEGATLTLEPSLSKLEDAAKPVFEQLLRRDSLAELTEANRGILSVFFAVQFTRTRAFREQWRTVGDLLRDKLRGWAQTNDERVQVDAYVGPYDDNRDTMELTRFIADAPAMFGPHFVSKTWVLLKTEAVRPFMIGDNPLALHNSIDMGPRGNLGLAVHGIEIYFPICPTRTLAMWCPSLVEEFLSTDARLRTSPAYLFTRSARSGDWAKIDAISSAIRTGQPLQSNGDNVLHCNSLQVRNAERYVFSSVNDFELAREMTESPEMRFGPRPTAG